METRASSGACNVSLALGLSSPIAIVDMLSEGRCEAFYFGAHRPQVRHL